MNCTAHADVDQNDGGTLKANQTLIEHTPHAIQLYYIDQWARDPNGGNVYYVTIHITFHIPEFARKERNLHCDVVYITTAWVSRLAMDHAVASIHPSR